MTATDLKYTILWLMLASLCLLAILSILLLNLYIRMSSQMTLSCFLCVFEWIKNESLVFESIRLVHSLCDLLRFA